MNLLSINLARSIWFLPLIDLNPKGKAVWPKVLVDLTNRYDFVKAPTAVEVIDGFANNKPILFSGGTFKSHDSGNVIVDLTLYREGMVCDTRTGTEVSDSFVAEVMNWIHTDHGLENGRALHPRRAWLSEIYVQMPGESLSGFAGGLQTIAQKFSKMVQVPSMESAPKVEVGGIGFWLDPTESKGLADFRLERARDFAFSSFRYYSSAPLQTKQHLELLRDIENLLPMKG